MSIPSRSVSWGYISSWVGISSTRRSASSFCCTSRLINFASDINGMMMALNIRPRILAIREISVRARPMANSGVAIMLSSKCCMIGITPFNFSSLGRIFSKNPAKTAENGRKISARLTLKIVWALAIWRAGSDPNIAAMPWMMSAKVGIQKINKMTPQTLKSTCARATRFASRDVPILARPAVIQVPILAPKTSGMPASSVINPCCARTITMPVNALELWIRAVNTVPINRPKSGFSRPFIKLMSSGQVLSGSMASLISFIPKNRTPNPKRTSPIFLKLSFFPNIRMPKPMVTISRA